MPFLGFGVTGLEKNCCDILKSVSIATAMIVMFAYKGKIIKFFDGWNVHAPF